LVRFALRLAEKLEGRTMMRPIKKAAGGYQTTTATTSQNAADFIAAGARQASAKARFDAKPCTSIDRLLYRAAKGCATVLSGAQNTTDNAGNLPDSEVFSRPEFKVLDVGIAYPQGRQHGVIHVLNPHIQSLRLKSAVIGFQSHNGAETMTTVNTHPTPKTGNPSLLARQQAIEAALEDALHFIRTDHPGHSLCLATARTRRALSMLKQACAEVSQAVRSEMGGAA
jgi:hypothetical protein